MEIGGTIPETLPSYGQLVNQQRKQQSKRQAKTDPNNQANK